MSLLHTSERNRSHHRIMKHGKNPPHPGAHAPRPHAHLFLTIIKGRGGRHRSTSVYRCTRTFSRSGRSQRSSGRSSGPDRPVPSADLCPCLGTPSAVDGCEQRSISCRARRRPGPFRPSSGARRLACPLDGRLASTADAGAPRSYRHLRRGGSGPHRRRRGCPGAVSNGDL
jgi:hypothetical protein